MFAKWYISSAFILCLTAVILSDEPRPTIQSTSATLSRSSSTTELVRQVAEQLVAANKLEESFPDNRPKEAARIRSAEEAKELSVQIAEVQKQLDRLRELTGRPSQIEFRFRVLEVPAKLAAELSSLGTELLTGSSVVPLTPNGSASLPDTLVGDSNSQGGTLRAAAGGKIEQSMRETDASWGSSSRRRGSMVSEENVLAYCVAATRAAACEAGSNAAAASGGESGVAGSGHRYRQSGDVERTAHAADGEGGGGRKAVAVGSSLLHGDRLADGYRAGS